MAVKTRFSAKNLSKTALAIALSVALYPFSHPSSADISRGAAPNLHDNNAIILAQMVNPQTAANTFSQYYSYCDAELLAAFYPGLASAWDAKVWAGEKIMTANYNVWNNDLIPAIQHFQTPIATPDFWCYWEQEATQYTMNDAQRVACAWQTTIDQGKLIIGAAIAAHQTDTLAQGVQQAGC